MSWFRRMESLLRGVAGDVKETAALVLHIRDEMRLQRKALDHLLRFTSWPQPDPSLPPKELDAADEESTKR